MITKVDVPLWLCALIDILPIAGSFNIYSLMLVIAVDRILSIFFPIWSDNLFFFVRWRSV